MKKIFLILMGYMWCVGMLPAQTTFNRRYGSGTDEWGNAIIQTKDSGFAVVGGTYEYGADGDIFIMKLDKHGTIQWQKDIFGVNQDFATSVYQLSNGNYVIGGTTLSYGSGCGDAWVIMLDSTGNLIWSKTYGDVSCQNLGSLIQTKDGGYAGCGSNTSLSKSWIFKINSSGDLQWSKYYNYSQYFAAIRETQDGGYLAVGPGYTYPNLGGTGPIQILKTDSLGNPSWNATYLNGVGNNSMVNDVIVLPESGDAVITGEVYYNAYGNESDVFLLKIDQNGNRIWFKTYGYTFFEYGVSVKPTHDNGYIVAGYTNSFGFGNYDALLIKIDSGGNMLWAKTYGDEWQDEAIQVQVLYDGGFIFTGNSFTRNNGSSDDSSYTYIVRTDSNGVVPCHYLDWTPLVQTQTYTPITSTVTATTFGVDSTCSPPVNPLSFEIFDYCDTSTGIHELEKSESNINISPNPAQNVIYVQLQGGAKAELVELYSITGQKMQTSSRPSPLGEGASFSYVINSSSLSDGVYFLKVQLQDGGTLVKKVEIVR